MKLWMTCIACLLWSLLAAPSIAASTRLPPVPVERARIHADDNFAWSSDSFNDSNWPLKSWSKLAPWDGVLWMRARVTVPEIYVLHHRPVGLYLSATASAQVWWDGQLLGSKGTVGETPAEEIPGDMDTVFLVPPRLITADEHVLAIRLSTQHTGSIILTPIDSLYLAQYAAPASIALRHYLPSLLSASALLLTTIFLAVMFELNRNDYSFLWLSLLCLSVLGQLLVEASRALVTYSYNWQAWRLMGIIGFAWLAGVFLIAHLGTRFSLPRSGRWVIGCALAALAAAIAVPSPDAKTLSVIVLYLLSAIGMCARALHRDRRDAWVALASLITLVAVALTSPMAFLDKWLYLAFTSLLLLFFADHLNVYRQTQRQREAAGLRSSRLELELLKKYLQPHFLMNTLTSLTEWVEQNPSTGVHMIDALAKELRLLNSMAGRKLVPLITELQLCDAHLAVMGYRNDRHYQLCVDCSDQTQNVPPALFHTLVENALTHNDYADGNAIFSLKSESLPDGGTRYNFRAPCGRQAVRVQAGDGTGLAYIRARLQEAFGDGWSLHTGARRGDDWITVVDIHAT